MSSAEAPTTAPADAPAPADVPGPAPAEQTPAEQTAAEQTVTEGAEAPNAEQWAQAPMPVLDDAESAISSLQSSSASITDSILEYRTIHGRTYHSDRKGGENVYWGPNDEKQNEGIDIVYHALELCLDGALHKAPLPDDFAGKALDLGTGTGIWAIDFADAYPSAEVVGVDLSPIQPSWVPVNCQFQIDDITQDWTFRDESLDYVHLRWMVGCVGDWTALARQAYRCLKPGGYIEWLDFDAVIHTDDDSLPKDAAFAQWTGIYESAVAKLGLGVSFRICHDDTMSKSFTDAGFEDVHEDDFKAPLSGWSKDRKLKEIGDYVHAAIDQDCEGYLTASASALGWRPEEIMVYAAYLRKELREKKIHHYFRGKNVWARKPLNA